MDAVVSGGDGGADAARPSTINGKRVSIAVVACLVLAGLLVSDKLVEVAERQPLGDSRDRWVDAAEGVDRVANFLSLNRPYDFIVDVRGAGGDAGEQVDTIEAVVAEIPVAAQEPEAVVSQEVEPPAAALTTEPVPADPVSAESFEFRTVTVDEPLRVYVAGDSQAFYVGHALATGSDGLLDVAVDSRNATGLARPGYFNWPAQFLEIVSEDDPELVVIFMGSSDWQDMEVGSGINLARGGPEWRDELAWRMGVAFDVLAAPHRRVVWVGLPPARDEPRRTGFPEINHVAAEVIAGRDRSDVVMVDTWDLFGGDGPYRESASPPGGGEPVRVREDDGFHLNRTGSAWVADIVRTAANRIWKMPDGE